MSQSNMETLLCLYCWTYGCLWSSSVSITAVIQEM